MTHVIKSLDGKETSETAVVALLAARWHQFKGLKYMNKVPCNKSYSGQTDWVDLEQAAFGLNALEK